MNDEQRICQNCQLQFIVDAVDQAYYWQIAVPFPTWCPECRAQRRMAWRNEWQIFRRPDAKSGKEVFSLFSKNAPVKVYEPDDWYADDWNPLEYGKEYDFSRSFFEQMKELMSEVPLLSRPVNDLENSDYSLNANHLKNCYLVRDASGSEDSAYLIMDDRSRNTFDCDKTVSCELCYDSFNLTNCYQTVLSVNCDDCRSVVLSKDCVSCSDCVGCVNLRNKQYCIFNEQLTKEEYEAKFQGLRLNSHQSLQLLIKKAHKFWLQHPNKFMHGTSNENVTGEYIDQSKNVGHSYLVRQAEDCKYCQQLLAGPTKACYDQTSFSEGVELVYESVVIGHQSYNLKFCWNCWTNCRNLQYSMFCQSSSDLFGCVGLRGKQYCILNKQYTKDEYEALVPKIIEQMNQLPYADTLGRIYRYGEFFPIELSPFEYNATFAQEHFALTKDEAIAKGCRWYDQPLLGAPIQHATDQLPDVIENVQAAQAFAGQVIECAHRQQCNDQCVGGFTVIAQEAAFLLEQGLPLPRLCPNCRHVERIAFRNPMTLHHRQCMCEQVGHDHQDRCPNEFETTYSPDRPEIVYCEDCYQKEII
jgi:hypothetical protein